MSSLHNDLTTWAAKARAQGRRVIVIDIDTADKIAEALRQPIDIAEAYKRLKWVLDETGLDNDLRAVKAADLRIILNALGGMK